MHLQQGTTECSLYTQGCCGGDNALCTMSIRCSQPEQPGCLPICKRLEDVGGEVTNITFADSQFPGWEAGKPGAPGHNAPHITTLQVGCE